VGRYDAADVLNPWTQEGSIQKRAKVDRDTTRLTDFTMKTVLMVPHMINQSTS
jgi:hypothetical protein